MNILEKIKKIKVFLNEEEISTELKDIKTADGTILSYDNELAVGAEIFVVDESGRNPAPDGEYILEDGSKIEVMKGKIEEIKSPEAPVEMPVEEIAPVEGTETKLSIEDLATKIQMLEEENVKINEILTQLAQTLSDKTFEKEVKMSIMEPTINVIPEQSFRNQKNNELNTIFKNMYKK